jgi:hypothetical protein
LKEHTHHFLRTKFDGEWKGNQHVQKLLQQWEEKVKTPDEDWRSEKNKKMYFEMLNSQRAFLIQANQDPSLDEEIVRYQLYLIDLEEERISCCKLRENDVASKCRHRGRRSGGLTLANFTAKSAHVKNIEGILINRPVQGSPLDLHDESDWQILQSKFINEFKQIFFHCR